MLRNQRIRLLGQLAAFFVLAATFALPGVSHGSVVDQYTEIVPTPGGGRPSEPSLPPSTDAPAPAPAVAQAPESGAVVVEDVAAVPEAGRSGKPTGSPSKARQGGTEVSAEALPKAPAAPGGMGLLFPALLLLGVVASAGFVIGRRWGAAPGGVKA